jgi:transcriptional regulator with XRE-family HTH domain
MAKKVIPTPFPSQSGEITFEFLGEYIKAKRTQSGLTMHQAAMLCNVPVDVFTKLEKGRGSVTLESFLKIVNGLGLDIKFGNES